MEPYMDVRSFCRTRWALAMGMLCLTQMPLALAQNETEVPSSPQSASPVAQSAAPVEHAGNTAQEPIQELVVVGTRASLQSAIGRKKNSGTVVDSIVAEDISSFPDKNIGEALSRITGVQLNRDFGEGTSVSIRGVEPDLNRVEINGVSQVSSGGSRSGDFRELASELVKSIDVFKGFTADMTEGGIGGTVSIETIKPLELRKPLFSITASEQYLDSTDTWKPRGNIALGDRFFNNRFGVLLNVTYDRNDTRGDFIRNTEWLRIADFDNSTEKTVVNPSFAQYGSFGDCASISVAEDRTACETQFYDYSPSNPRYGVWIRNDKRTSGMLTLQYQINDELDVYSISQYNQRKNRLIDNNFYVGTGTIDRFDLTQPVVVDENHNVVDFYMAQTYGGANNRGGTFLNAGAGNRNFAYVQESMFNSLGFNWKPSDDVTLSGMVATSKGDTNNLTNSVSVTASVPGIHVSLDPKTGAPNIQMPTGFDPTDASFYEQGATAPPGIAVPGPTVDFRPGYSKSQEDQAKWDLDWNTGWNFFNKLESGTQFRRTDLLGYAGGGRTETNGAVIPTANVDIDPVLGAQNGGDNTAIPTWTMEKYQSFLSNVLVPTPGTFFSGGGVNRSTIPNSWLTPNFNFDALNDYFDLSGFNTDKLFEAVGSDGNVYAQAPSYDIRETVGATYIKANFESEIAGMPLTGNFGVRYVQTSLKATGTNRIREQRVVGGTPVDIGTQIVAIDSNYHDILPSVNANLEIADNLFARIGWAKVMARPKPNDLVPNATCTFDLTGAAPSSGGTELDDCSAGNPDLKPYRADQYDINISWYPNRDTLLSAAVFYKDIKSFILTRTLVRGVDLFHDGRLFDVTQPINGAGAKMQGVELSAQTAFTFLPTPFDGLGGIVNYTFSDAKDVGLFNSLSSEELTFPGMSRHSYNVTLYYDKGPLNVRFAYNARTKWLQNAAERSGNPAYRDGAAYLDGKATVRVPNSGWSFFVEGKNLTGETERTSSGDIRLSEMSYPGQRYFVGVTYKFD